MKICPACNKTNNDDLNFCPVCGTKLNTTDPEPVNTIDEIELVNTRLRSAPRKPANNTRTGIIIGALCAFIIVMVVVIVCVVLGNSPKSHIMPDFDTPEATQTNNTIIFSGEERYYKPLSQKLYPDIIRLTADFVYLEFGFEDALYYGKASYTLSGETITLDSVDLEKFRAGGEIVYIGERPEFPEVHIMDAGASLVYDDTSITIVDFESYWVLESEYFEYPEEYKNGTVHYLTDDPDKVDATEATSQQNITTAPSKIFFAETGKTLCYTEKNHSPNPCIIQIYDNYVFITFPFFEGMYYARAEYTKAGNMVTLGSMDLYMIVSGETPSVKGVHSDFHDVHVMDSGARLCFNQDGSITVLDFEKYWVLKEDSFDCPDEFKNNKTLYLTNTPYDEVKIKEPNYDNGTTNENKSVIGDEGGEKYYYAPNGYPYGAHIYFDSNYVYLYFGYYDMLCLGRGTYTLSGNKVTLGSIDLYCDLTADGEAYVHKGEARQLHIMDAGATIEYNDSNIIVKGFKSKWALEYNFDLDSFPENYEDGSVLNKFN